MPTLRLQVVRPPSTRRRRSGGAGLRTERHVPDAARGAPVTPHLERLHQQYFAIRADAESLLDGLDDAQFNWRAAAGRWSIAECLDHLDAAVRLYLPEIDRAIRRGRERGLLRAGGEYRYGRLEWSWARSMEPPAKRRLPAPAAMAPSSSAIPAAAGRRSFLASTDAMIGRVKIADGLDLRRAKVRIPMFKLLRISLGATFELHGTHSRRHLWQARQVREDPRFPQRA